MGLFVETWGQFLAVVAEAGRVCVGLVFLLAATQKAQQWRLLSGVIANYRLLPGWMVFPATALLPPLEMLLAISLLSAQFRPWPELAATLLLMLFAAAMAINIRRGRTHIDCGCGRDFLAQKLDWPLVARNLLLVGLLLPSLPATSSLSLDDVGTGAAAGLGFFLLYLLFNQFLALPRARRLA
jgi:hypothetical protein